MKKILAAVVAAGALLGVPAAASATHVTDHDGPPVSSISAICKSPHGHAWYVMHGRAFTAYWNAMLQVGPSTAAGRFYHRLAMEHYTFIRWYQVACRKVTIV